MSAPIDLLPVLSRASEAAADAQLRFVVRHHRFCRLEPVAIKAGGERIWELTLSDMPFTGGLDEIVASAAAYLRRRDAEVR